MTELQNSTPAPEAAAAAGAARAARAPSRRAKLLRLLSLRRVEGLDDMAGDRALALLGLLSLGLWIGIDWLRADPGMQFDGQGIPALALVTLLILALALTASRLSRPQVPFRSALLVLLAALPPLIVLSAAIDLLAPGSMARLTAAALDLYALLYVWQGLRGSSGAAQPRPILGGVALLAAYLWFGQIVYVYPTLWASPEAPDDADQSMSADEAETLLFDQRPRLDQALERVAASSGAGGAMFFVGFAGVAAERVFAEEIKLASGVVAQRYGTGSRQLLLINDRRDFDSYPLASVSGLRYALQGVARKMNLQRDILFLSLSSHGSNDQSLTVANGALPLEQVTGDVLAAALNDAGIKWRIIVISACYAGAFIEPLRNPDTVLITAAAADRTSFGCSDDRDLTYFGEAFYRDALPRARSLEDAFALARAQIARRERTEKVTASDPQAYFGADIDRLLAQRPMRPPMRQAALN